MGLGPMGARDRPFVLVALDELVDMPHLQLDARLLRPIALALEEVVEEAQLELAAIVGIEVRPVLDAMRLEPFVFRRGADEAFEVAARVQPLPAPVGGGEEWHGDLVPLGRARLVVIVIQWVREDLVAEVAAVLLQLAVGERFVAADQLAGGAAARAALAQAV